MTKPIIAGTAESVHQQYNIAEFMIELPNTTIDERINAIRSLTQAKNFS